MTETSQETRATATRGSITVGIRSSLRQLATDPTVFIALSAVAFVTAFLLTVTPGLFEGVSAEALDVALAEASTTDRNLDVGKAARYGVRGEQDPFGAVRDVQENFKVVRMPESVASLVTNQAFVVDSPQFVVGPYPGITPLRFPTFMTLRTAEGISSSIALIEGSWPTTVAPVPLRVGADCPEVMEGEDPAAPPLSELEDLNGDGEVTCVDEETPRYELAVSEATLAELDADVGDRFLISPDTTDILFGSVERSRLQYNLIVEVSGVFEVTEPDAEIWFGDRSVERPRKRSNADFTDIFTTVLVAPQAHRELRRDLGLAYWDYSLHYFVDTSAITPTNVGSVAADMASLDAEYASAVAISTNQFTLQTALSEILFDYIERRDLALGMLALTFVGLLVVAVAVVVLLGALSAERQGTSTVLVRNRGASRRQVLLARAIQGLLVFVPASVVAYWLALTLAPTSTSTPLLAAVGVVLGGTLVVVFAGSRFALHRLGRLQREDSTIRRSSGRRLVIEALLVVLAVGSLIILRRRGFESSEGLDLLAALGPILLAVAVSIVTLRVYPLFIRVVAWVGRRLKGLVVFVGFQRILQLAPVARLPLTVVLLATAVAVFTSVVRTSIVESQLDSTWHETGAAHRISSEPVGFPLPGLDLTAASSVEATAEAVLARNARVADAPPDAPRLADILSLEGSDYSAVVSGTRAETPLPPWFHDEFGQDNLGTFARPIPAIVVGGWTAQGPPEPGVTLSLGTGSDRSHYVVREYRSSFPGIDSALPTFLVPLAASETASGLELRPTTLFIRAPESAATTLSTVVDATGGSSRLTSQAALLAEIRGESFAAAVVTALWVTFAAAAVFAMLAAVSSMALMAKSRQRDIGFLRTLGMNRDQGLWVTLIEQLPPMVTATVVGGLLGVATAILLEPTVDLDSFSGQALPAALGIDVSTIVVTTTLMLLVVTVAVVIFSYIDRRQNLGKLVKVGDE